MKTGPDTAVAPASAWARGLRARLGLWLRWFPSPDLSDELYTTHPPYRVVIGEDMADRVIPFAKKNGDLWYKAVEAPEAMWMENSRIWIRTVMDDGAYIIDVGPAPARENYPLPSSANYAIELEEIARWGYKRYKFAPVPGE